MGSSRCPQCNNVASVSSEALAAAGGLLRCGSCGAIFNARSEMIEDAKDEHASGSTLKHDAETAAAAPEYASVAESSPPRIDQASEQDRPSSALETPTPPEQTADPAAEFSTHDEPEARLRISRDSLSNDFEAAPSPQGRSPLWAVAAMLLAIALGLQALNHYWLPINYYADRNNTRWLQTALTGLCQGLACSRPIRAESQLLSSGGLTVREHPELQDSLLVELFIDNRTEFPQAAPQLSLEFADISGLAIAERHFAAGDYLKGELLGEQVLPADQAIRVKLAILDPDPDAVNYRLELIPAVQKVQYPLPWLAPGGR